MQTQVQECECVLEVQAVAISNVQLTTSAGYSVNPKVSGIEGVSSYTRVTAVLEAAFEEELAAGPIFSYAQFSDGTSMDVTTLASTLSASPSIFNVTTTSPGTVDLKARTN